MPRPGLSIRVTVREGLYRGMAFRVPDDQSGLPCATISKTKPGRHPKITPRRIDAGSKCAVLGIHDIVDPGLQGEVAVEFIRGAQIGRKPAPNLP